MVNVIGEGADGPATTVAVTSQEMTAYQAAVTIPAAQRTSTQQNIVDTVEAAVATVASADWTAIQAANQAEILAYAGEVQAAMTRVIRNYAPKGNERAFTEMFSIVTRELINLKREIIDLQNP